ncbi:MAG TPA: glycosyltransferase [Puia sp.]|nr:glycosyltransferase [Puia sp.]
MESTPNPLSESSPIDNNPGPDNLLTTQLQLELSLLKSDYKRLLVEYYQKKELLGIQTDSMATLKSSIATLIQSISILTDENEGMANERSRLNEDASDKDNIISEQNRKIHGLHQQIDTLNVKLSEIYASEGWKLLSVYYGLRNGLLPQGSPRQKKVKKIVNWLRRKKNDNIVLKDYSAAGGESTNRYERKTPVEFIPFEFPRFSNPKVSIIIPAYNGWEMNYLCLRSIKENTEGLSYEVIFADDLSTDETQYVDRTIKNIVHIRNEKNLGFLQNCNHAASFARGEYLHFLNNDTEVTTGWLSSLVTQLENDKTIGMTGSKLVYPDGRLQEAGGIIWQDASGWNYGHKQDPANPIFNYVKEVDYISGASVMIRADLWVAIGGFDTRYSPAYFEDTDLAFEVRNRGYKVVYQPLSEIIHFEGFSHGSENNGQTKEGSIKNYQNLNKVKFLEKWKDVLEKKHFPNAENVFWARDKSRDKKTILVIDHYVPHFDKDAGSRHTYQYLQLLVEMGLNVKFIGDNFYKHEPYTTTLQQLGIEVLYGEHFKNHWKEWILENQNQLDFIYLHRPHIAIKYIDFIKENTNCKVIYFGHDLHYYREEKQYEIEKNEKLLESADNWKKTEISLFEKSNLIITPSEKEREIITALSKSFNVSTIPLFYFKESNPPITDFSSRENIIFVGGFNHTPNVDAVIWFLKEVWPLIKDQLQEIKFIIVGSNVPAEIKELEGTDIIVAGYVSDADLERLYSQIRLAIIPLRYGAGIKGKTLEAMHNGIPLVTTPEGIEGLPGDTGFIKPVRNTLSFAEQVIKLYRSDTNLMELSSKEILYMQENFSHAAAKSIFSALLASHQR